MRTSPLYCRANGFMLGAFLALARYAFARPLYRVHRARIQEFMAELDMPVQLPDSHRDYGRAADRVLQEYVLICRHQAAELGDFVLLGAMVVIDGTTRLAGAVESDDLRDEACAILERHGLAASGRYDRYLARIRLASEEHPGVRVDSVLSPALELLVDCIEPLPVDPQTCFVAMPFRGAFAGHFGAFYRPLAEELQAAALRMWGGLSGEAYVDLMLAIIRRSGRVIADLTGANPNVLYEFGVARGLAKPVVVLCQRKSAPELPANIVSDQLLLLYSPREKGWPQASILRCALQSRLIELGTEHLASRLAGLRWSAGGVLPEVPDMVDMADEGEPAPAHQPDEGPGDAP
jgi:hypothetical protein